MLACTGWLAVCLRPAAVTSNPLLSVLRPAHHAICPRSPAALGGRLHDGAAGDDPQHRCAAVAAAAAATLGLHQSIKIRRCYSSGKHCLVVRAWGMRARKHSSLLCPSSPARAAKSVVNLSRQDLLLALAEGKRATWAKLSAIEVGG